MKSVLISIQPKWCEKIANDKKTIEVRKTAPKEVPFKAYIYCSYGKDKENYMLGKRGKVIGEFICDKVYLIKNQGNRFFVADEEQSVTNEIARQSCLDYNDMVSYLGNKDGYGWYISDLKIYDKPRGLNEFTPFCKYKGDFCEACLHYVKAFGGCCKTLKRPPQSWQYVNEVEE